MTNWTEDDLTAYRARRAAKERSLHATPLVGTPAKQPKTPDERNRADESQERDLLRLCQWELHRRGIESLHLSTRAREKKGWPDLTFSMPAKPHGRPFAVELKTSTGRLSDDQAKMLHDLAQDGWITAIVRSIESFIDLIGLDERG